MINEMKRLNLSNYFQIFTAIILKWYFGRDFNKKKISCYFYIKDRNMYLGYVGREAYT